MQSLQLPKTIRTARYDEVPKDPEVIARIDARKTAKIVQGYIVKPNPEPGDFTFYAEVNIDIDQLWKLFRHLVLQLPDFVALVYGFKDEEPEYGRYMDKFELLNILNSFEVELTNDGFLEFGVLYSDGATLEEVFVAPAKYIKYWGTDEEQFRETMHAFSIYEVADLEFIDEFPLVTEAVRLFIEDIRETGDVMESLRQSVLQ